MDYLGRKGIKSWCWLWTDAGTSQLYTLKPLWGDMDAVLAPSSPLEMVAAAPLRQNQPKNHNKDQMQATDH